MKLLQTSPEEDVVVYARAEQQLCESSGPALAAVIQAIALQDGLRITELRVTFDWNGQNGQVGGQVGESILANCTIVKVQPLAVSGDGAGGQVSQPRRDASRSANGESGDVGSA